MAKLTQVVNVLSTWGYITVVRIKTRPDPALKIVVKRTSDFQKNFDEFALQLQQRREERDRLKAEKQAEAAAGAEETKEDSAEAKDADADESKAQPAAAQESQTIGEDSQTTAPSKSEDDSAAAEQTKA